MEHLAEDKNVAICSRAVAKDLRAERGSHLTGHFGTLLNCRSHCGGFHYSKVQSAPGKYCLSSESRCRTTNDQRSIVTQGTASRRLKTCRWVQLSAYYYYPGESKRKSWPVDPTGSSRASTWKQAGTEAVPSLGQDLEYALSLTHRCSAVHECSHIVDDYSLSNSMNIELNYCHWGAHF